MILQSRRQWKLSLLRVLVTKGISDLYGRAIGRALPLVIISRSRFRNNAELPLSSSLIFQIAPIALQRKTLKGRLSMLLDYSSEYKGGHAGDQDSPSLPMCLSSNRSSFSCTLRPRGKNWKRPDCACSFSLRCVINQCS